MADGSAQRIAALTGALLSISYSSCSRSTASRSEIESSSPEVKPVDNDVAIEPETLDGAHLVCSENKTASGKRTSVSCHATKNGEPEEKSILQKLRSNFELKWKLIIKKDGVVLVTLEEDLALAESSDDKTWSLFDLAFDTSTVTLEPVLELKRRSDQTLVSIVPKDESFGRSFGFGDGGNEPDPILPGYNYAFVTKRMYHHPGHLRADAQLPNELTACEKARITGLFGDPDVVADQLCYCEAAESSYEYIRKPSLRWKAMLFRGFTVYEGYNNLQQAFGSRPFKNARNLVIANGNSPLNRYTNAGFPYLTYNENFKIEYDQQGKSYSGIYSSDSVIWTGFPDHLSQETAGARNCYNFNITQNASASITLGVAGAAGLAGFNMLATQACDNTMKAHFYCASVNN